MKVKIKSIKMSNFDENSKLCFFDDNLGVERYFILTPRVHKYIDYANVSVGSIVLVVKSWSKDKPHYFLKKVILS